MRHIKGFAIALCAIALCMLLDIAAQTPRGMMWTEDDEARPVAMIGCSGVRLAKDKLAFTDYNIEHGYFEVGEFQGHSGPGTWESLVPQVKALRGRDVEVILRVTENQELQKVVR